MESDIGHVCLDGDYLTKLWDVFSLLSNIVLSTDLSDFLKTINFGIILFCLFIF